MDKFDRRRRARKGIIVVIALLLAIYLIGSTYARYSTIGAATAKADIAEWHVQIKNGSTQLTSTTQDINFVVQSNTNVVSGKIAPAVTAVATVDLDLTGTEVAVDISAVIDQSAISTIGASSDKISLAVAIDGNTYSSGTTQTIPLVNNSAFTSANGQKSLTLTLTWTNDDENNADDTTMGTAGGTISIPVTFTARQHIA